MSLLSGNDLEFRSYVFEILDTSNIGEARRFAAQLTSALRFTEERSSRVSIVVTELGTNLARHAEKGRLILQGMEMDGVRSIQILAIDSGPGIRDPKHSMTDGITSGTSPGTGLGAIRRQSDEFDIHSSAEGTLLYASVHATDSPPLADKPRFAVAAICTPIQGEFVSGDAWCQLRGGESIVMMIADGLGHGPKAHQASSAAVEVFGRMDAALPLDIMMKRMHEVLKPTRGAAISLLRWSQRTHMLESLGIGNVRTVIITRPRDKTLITSAGTVGLQYRNAVPLTTPWTGDNYVVMHSDGLHSRWNIGGSNFPPDKHPALLAGLLYRDQVRGTDDATVLVGGYIS